MMFKRFQSQIKNFRLSSYIFPPCCILCGDRGIENIDLCLACYQELPRHHPRCYRCGDSFESSDNLPALCLNCLTSPPAFDETFAPFVHHATIRYLIINLKFNKHYPTARLLGYLMAEHFQKTAEKPECIIPVPLHKKRYRERGYNQSIELARIIAKHLKIPMDSQSCYRSKDTLHQVGLNAEQRRENIKAAFGVKPSFNASHVALVDDVMTTGSTLNELAFELKKAGCQRIQLWVCAKAQ